MRYRLSSFCSHKTALAVATVRCQHLLSSTRQLLCASLCSAAALLSMSERPTEEQPAFTLYGDWLSTATQRVVFTALELKLKYEFRALDCIKAVDTRTIEYLAMNPFGRVPAAIVDGVTMYESRAIARMLAEKFQSRASQLLPTDFRGRALFEQVTLDTQRTAHATYDTHTIRAGTC